MNPLTQINLTLTNAGEDGWRINVVQPDSRTQRSPKYALERDSDSGLFRARALRDIYDGEEYHRQVRAGELSGLLESESSLSQEGSCWVWPNASVRDSASVHANATVRDQAVVSGGASLYGSARLHNTVKVMDNAEVGGRAVITNRAVVKDGARVDGDARVEQDAVIGGHANVGGTTLVQERAAIKGYAYLYGGQFRGDVRLGGQDDELRISTGCWVGDMTAEVPNDFLQLSTRWGHLTVSKSATGGWAGSVGCQHFTTFQGLRRIAQGTARQFELDLMPHWFEMMKALFANWGLDKDLIERTTADGYDGEF